MTRVQANDRLTLHFALREHGSGNDIDSSFNDQPLTLTLGDGTLEPALEYWLLGLVPHSRQVFILEPGQAFGDREPLAVVSLPQDRFCVQPPEPGQLVEFTLEDGSQLTGIITSIETETVTVDFNHILAGKKIEFEVEILSINGDPSSATPEIL
ncbi:MAG TPA: FKBP-type peptidyl-prolyl cis-trans isomerase [Burkholderiales bacterium]|nr:FKBP-type peptidyl-prolyl cis-trans isomerase [Burkholderiales bacterium]